MGVLHKKYLLLSLTSIFLGVCIDGYTKYLAQTYLVQGQEGVGYLTFILTYNTGIAFSFPITGPLQQIITILLILGISYILLQSLRGKIQQQQHEVLGLSFILSGALGNGIERFSQSQQVTDFIAVKHFAIFNIADILICVGAILYLFLPGILKYLAQAPKKYSDQHE